eukprot:CAMPEP_0170359886 /NCGR_PEP_ID=MMETSP0117_2-20130122/2989_1 /TAXON_ID=400756 /ORGANISM="Durinskia baltica, Strain CSIRO CS-38" /LENGTH=82 /DNA_ID=CAMNT_0010614169 /DNA_START=999 /DNA_END=1244 /DNA_ORIENTATION=-
MPIEEIAAMEAALKMERADVEEFDMDSVTAGPETEGQDQPAKVKKNKDKSKSLSFSNDKSKKSEVKKKKNPNILDYPKETIY